MNNILNVIVNQMIKTLQYEQYCGCFRVTFKLYMEYLFRLQIYIMYCQIKQRNIEVDTALGLYIFVRVCPF